MSENKKVKNACKQEYNSINFNSVLEKNTYILLKEAGFNPQYEPQAFTIWQGKKFSVPCYDVHNDRKLRKDVWGINTYKPVNIRYTPDFVFNVLDSSGATRMIVIESKGFPNERYAYVKKLFRSYLEENYPNSIFFEVHNKEQVKTAIEVINSIMFKQ